ncbi:hypothetical protein R8Z50_06055 [Longispora sp. K20-0274]|uniref:hypothetical protein n=1 Tax=Longispora sp. K20-0274 TaxID=3088255 RepID=UPI00399C2094
MERAVVADPPPPLAELLRGGRGGEVRLKLLLSMLWLVREDPAPVLASPARSWATLLGLPDPEGKGARRVNDAIAWLEVQGYLVAEQDPAKVQRLITLKNETGSGEDWSQPGKVIRQLEPGDPARSDHMYVQLPPSLWTSGWITILSGASIAMLLLLYRQLAGADPDKTALWFSPEDAKIRFALSNDTRSKGLQELTMAGIISMERRSVNPHSFDYERVRNVYRLNPDKLKEPAEFPKDYIKGWEGILAAAVPDGGGTRYQQPKPNTA